MAVPTLDRHLELRAYDETPTTPSYTVITLIEVPEVPMTEPRPEQTVYLPGGKGDTDNLLIYTPSEVPIYEPQTMSITFTCDNQQFYILDSLGNPRRQSPWDIAGTTFIPVTAANIGTRTDSQGNAVAMPGPSDQVLIDSMVNLELGHNTAPGGGGALAVTRLLGVVARAARWGVDGERLIATVDLEIYGAIDATATAFTTGTAVHH